MSHDDLATQIERLRLELQAGPPTVANNLSEIERHLLWQRDATIGHIRHIASIRDESDAMIRAELETLRSVLVRGSGAAPAPAPVPPPLPDDPVDIEKRWLPPRFMRAAE